MEMTIRSFEYIYPVLYSVSVWKCNNYRHVDKSENLLYTLFKIYMYIRIFVHNSSFTPACSYLWWNTVFLYALHYWILYPYSDWVRRTSGWRERSTHWRDGREDRGTIGSGRVRPQELISNYIPTIYYVVIGTHPEVRVSGKALQNPLVPMDYRQTSAGLLRGKFVSNGLCHQSLTLFDLTAPQPCLQIRVDVRVTALHRRLGSTHSSHIQAVLFSQKLISIHYNYNYNSILYYT